MTNPASSDVLVVGGGIGGLASALALARTGRGVTVLEQAPAITEVGAGLQISPNGARVLRALGLDPDSIGPRTHAVELRDQSGALVTRLDLSNTPGFHLCHRADLIAALEQGVRRDGVSIALGQQVHAIRHGVDGLDVMLATGPAPRAGLVVGADGLRSVVRGALNGGAEPFFTGQIAWRALIPGDDASPVAQVFMGPGCHLVSYPLRGGALRNLVFVSESTRWTAEGWSHPDSPDTLRARFSGFGGPVREWLTALEQVFLWGLFRHPVAPRWHDSAGTAALVGDAAHPTLPFMAQGANLALEDAWVLAHSLSSTANQSQALARYQEARRTRATKVIEAANANARNYHLGGFKARAAHSLLRLGHVVAPGAALARYRWIYDHDVTKAQLSGS